MRMTVFETAAKLLKACKQAHAEFVIYFHKNPDGDCVGSAYALALILQQLGAKCTVAGEVPAQFRYLTDVFQPDAVSEEHALAAAVDCKDYERIVNGAAQYAFWIDHHGTDEPQAETELVDEACSSCGELILALAEEMGVTVTKDMANLLFAALVTDTNSFRTPSVNMQSFAAAAKLAAYGADVYEIARRHTLAKSQARIRIEQKAYAHMNVLCDGRLITMMLTADDLAECGIADPNDPALANVNSLPAVLDTAWLTVMLREYPADCPYGRMRFSVKSNRETLSALAAAELLGGGGHFHAAGGYLDAEPDEARRIIEETCARYLEAHKD